MLIFVYDSRPKSDLYCKRVISLGESYLSCLQELEGRLAMHGDQHASSLKCMDSLARVTYSKHGADGIHRNPEECKGSP